MSPLAAKPKARENILSTFGALILSLVMDVDGTPDVVNTKSSNSNRVQKKRRNKSKASITFPAYKDRKRTGTVKRQKR